MSREVLQMALDVLKGCLEHPDAQDSIIAIEHELAQPEQEPVAFPSRRAVERAIESVENPKGMHLNDGKERVILPGGTLRYMLALIDHTSPPQRQPLTEEEILKCFAESDGTFISSGRAIEAAHGIGDKT